MRIEIEHAVGLLQQGQLVAFPTETVYGLGALATDQHAVESVYRIKHRPLDNPLICHFASAYHIEQYTTSIPEYWHVLVSHFSPGPVSYLLECVDDRLVHATRGSRHVLCRIPNHPLTLQLIDRAHSPIVGPSANPSGQPSATNVAMVEEYFGEQMCVVDGGSSLIGLESTIIDCRHRDRIVIMRPGQICADDIQQLLLHAGYSIPVSYANQHDAVVPGSKYRHYSPQTIIYKTTTRNPIHDRGDIALIAPTELLQCISTTEVTYRIDLGSMYSPGLIAHNLYANLHQLDKLGVRHAYLLMRPLSDNGIELALSNRLSKVGEWRAE